MDVLFIELLLENIMFIGLYRICVYVGAVFVCEQKTQIKVIIFIQGWHL